METKSDFANTLALFFNLALLIVFALLVTDNLYFVNGYSLKKIIFFYSLFLYFYLICTVFYDINVTPDRHNSTDTIVVVMIISFTIIPSLILPKIYYVSESDRLTKGLFWFVILFWTVISSIIFKTDKVEGDRTNFLTYLSLFWLFLCFYTTIGSEIYDFAAKPIEDLAAINQFFDARMLVGLLVLAFITCKAIVNAFSTALPEIDQIKRFQIPYTSDNIFSYFTKPLILVINIILSVVTVLVNILWIITAFVTICIARLFYNIALELAKQYIRFIYIKLILILVFIGTCFAAGTYLENVADHFRDYLSSDLLAYQKGMFFSVSYSSLVIIILMLLKILIYGIVFNEKEGSFLKFLRELGDYLTVVFQATVPKLVYLMAVLWVTGWVLTGLSNIKTLGVVHFKQAGPYTFGMTCLIGVVGITYSLYSFISNKTT